MRTGVQVILGREPERAAIARFVQAAQEQPAALSLEGTAGIGKTTLWMDGVAEARLAGCRLLSTRAAESEARFSYAGLGDLFSDALTDALPSLPTPQRLALEQALLRVEATQAPPDPRAVSLASAGVIRTLAASGPVMIAIDDVQWLDTPSARVLAFVIRRLSDEPVGVIVSVRVSPGSVGDPLDMARALPQLVRIPVDRLEVDVIGRLLRDRVGDLPRPAIIRIHDIAHGNPLFALEIARAALREGARWEPGSPLPVPEDLQQLLSARLAALSPSSSAILLAIAATSQPTVELAIDASGSPDAARAGLAEAEQAGIIERADARVRFTHPLLGSTVYANAAPGERRSLHLRLADLLADPEERARHLALAADGPDESVAQELERAAEHARARGAPDAAADLMELALRRTDPAGTDAWRHRHLEAAEYHFDAGDAEHAKALLRVAIETLPAGVERAELLYRLSSMSWMNLINGVREPAMRALADAGDDLTLRSGILQPLAWVAFYLGDLPTAREHAIASAACAAASVDPAAKADALATLSVIGFVRGEADDGSMAEALRLQDLAMSAASWTEASVYTTPRSILGLQLMWSGLLDEARVVLHQELATYEEHAIYTVRQEVLDYLAELECRAGRWVIAAEHAAEAMEIIVESGQSETQAHVGLFNQALAAAYLGREDDARRMATNGVELARANDDAFNEAWNHAVLGFLALSLSNYEEAHEHLAPAVDYLDRMGAAEPGIIPCEPDDVEALVMLGRHGEAEEVLRRFESRAAVPQRPWALAAAGRCRGLLLASVGDVARAGAVLDAALEDHERSEQPFERARTLLALGDVQRRLKRKRLARSTLGEALDVFDELGAPLWASKARSALDRLGAHPAGTDLTPTEARVATLVVEGKTNRQVADALFISIKTVEANLSRVFHKLGVHSRTELMRAMLVDDKDRAADA